MEIDDERDSTIFLKLFSEPGMVKARVKWGNWKITLEFQAESPFGIVGLGVLFTLRMVKRIVRCIIYQGGTAGKNLLVPIWDEKVFLFVYSGS
jgi:hypothetical protein